MNNWFVAFSILGYKSVHGLDLCINVLGIGERSLFTLYIENNKIEEVHLLWFRIYG